MRDFGNYIIFYCLSIINCVILYLIDFVKFVDWFMKIRKKEYMKIKKEYY